MTRRYLRAYRIKGNRYIVEETHHYRFFLVINNWFIVLF